MTAGFLLVMFSSGWLVLGHSQPKKREQLGAARRRSVTAEPSRSSPRRAAALTFAPSSLSVKTGIYAIDSKSTVANTAHTLNFDEPATLWAGLGRRATRARRCSRGSSSPRPATTRSSARSRATDAAGMQGVDHGDRPADDARRRPWPRPGSRPARPAGRRRSGAGLGHAHGERVAARLPSSPGSGPTRSPSA